ncbi:MAG TPA: CHASE3 domain-containing protein [Bryobacterales bacterium]|nr:CHASE3 domain-containing protein [Bryobacterales bacterium]
MNLRIGARILLGFGLALLISAIVSVVSYRSTVELVDSADWVAHTHQVREKLADVLSALKDAETGQRGFLITGQERYLEPYDAALQLIDRDIQDVRQFTADNPVQQKNVETLQTVANGKLAELRQTMELRKQKGFDVALKEVLTDKGKALMDDARRVVRDMEEEENRRLKQRDEQQKASARATTTVIVFGGLLSVVLVGIAGAVIQRSITRPLAAFMQFVERVGQGDLTQQAPISRGDELGDLGRSLNQMVTGLKEVAGQTRGAAENLKGATAEILASTQQQASSTGEQAAAVQETTATMAEISQSGAQISERAKQVAAAAEATSAASNAGLQAVQGTTRTIEAIREQAEAVAENVVVLSEKTQAVGEIIATVNNIAEQSHLLALNAAIEAAGAGEQGSRFSIVANEIKNLADQSKEATVQVRSILGDIQKGINSSVMLTEEAVKRAESGKQQADVADRTIRQLAENIQQSLQAFQQIAAGANQQQIGFDQVMQAVRNIGQASGQTADSTRQLEKAAAGLNALADQLRKVVVERYRL